MPIHDHDPRPLPTVGGSDVPVIVRSAAGLPLRFRDASPIKLWAELCGLIPYRDDAATDAQAAGLWLEDAVLARYASETQRVVGAKQMRFVGAYPWMHATVDGVSIPVTAYTTPEQVLHVPDSRIVEAKTSNDQPWPDPPADVVMQCQWAAMCSHRGQVDVPAFFVNSRSWRLYAIGRNYDQERRLRETVWAWYERHVIGATPPEPDDSAAATRALNRVYAKVDERAIDADWSDLALIAKLDELRERARELKAEIDKTRNEVRIRLGRHRAMVHPHTGDRVAFRASNGNLITRRTP